ncbi:MAG: oligosaccharide flippase family protein [Capsulimonadales bacterium]|nr:oligosaccharide flippase family protein [Capsulimonadales bacterium]
MNPVGNPPQRGGAWNGIANYARFLLTMVVQFALTPFIIERIGQADFGLWTLTFSVVGFLGLLDGGLTTGSVKFVAECRGSGDVARRNRIISALAAAYLVMAAVAVAVVFGLSFVYGRLFGIPAEQTAKAVAVLWLIATRSVILALPLGLFYGILFGERRLSVVYVVQSLSAVLYGIAVGIGLKAEGSVVLLAWLNLGAMLFEYGAYVLLAFRLVPDLRIAPHRADAATLKEVAAFSGSQLLVNVAALVRLRTDPILVQVLLSTSSVALYGIALRISESVFLLLKQGINVLAPTFAERHGASDTENVRAVFLRSSRSVLAFAVVLCVPLCLMAREIVSLWVGPTFAPASPVLIVLLAAMALAVPAQVAGLVLAMTGQHAFSARAQVVGMVLNLGASIVLAPLVGLTGVALGTLTATVAVDLGWVLPVALRAQGLSLGRYAARVVTPSLVAGAVQAAITVGLRTAYPPESLPMIAVLAVPGAMAFGVTFIALLPSDERTGLTHGMARRLRKPSSTD